jgi:hypothetical protein
LIKAGFAEYAGFTQTLTPFGRSRMAIRAGSQPRKIIDAIGAKEAFRRASAWFF